MLHFTNGDSAADLIARSGIPGTVVPWRDVLHEGPIPAELGLDELRVVRARFIADRGWGTYDRVLAEFAERDEQLAAFREKNETVLWFEADLYDQLQLLQILDWFAGQSLGRSALSLICVGSYPGVSPFHGLGQLTPSQIAWLFPGRRQVTAAQLGLGQAAWSAVRSPDPTAIERVIASDTQSLPFLGSALRRFLEEYPGVRDGLSRTERQAVERLRLGSSTPEVLFRAAADREERPFLGDATFWHQLQELAAGPISLLQPADGERFARLTPGEDPAPFVRRPLALTATGKAVAAGEIDYVSLNGLDRWLGGVHLTGRAVPWRWDHTGNEACLRRVA
jgi:hypothetical protein